MARAVLPKPSAKQIWLLYGQADRADGESQRAAPLEEDVEDWEAASSLSDATEEEDEEVQDDEETGQP